MADMERPFVPITTREAFEAVAIGDAVKVTQYKLPDGSARLARPNIFMPSVDNRDMHREEPALFLTVTNTKMLQGESGFVGIPVNYALWQMQQGIVALAKQDCN